jgi:hypothetical protein
MKRILSSLVLAGGLMFLGVTSASASIYCTDDPTLKLGLPVKYSINLTLSSPLVSANVYASGTYRTTTFGFGLGIL